MRNTQYHIIISIDYEIFGNGRGNVRRHIIKPAEKLFEIAEEFDIPLTWMFEVGEYEFFKKYDEIITRRYGYSFYEEIKNQIKKFYRDGHDIELHIHPQWETAEIRDNKIIIKNPYLSFSDLEANKISQIIGKGVDIIKGLIGKHYNVHAIRLTNLPWTEAPPHIIPILERYNIYIHSLSTSSNIKNKCGYWRYENSNVFEIPIHSIPTRNIKFSLKGWQALIYDYLYTRGHKMPSLRKSKEGYDKKWDLCKMNFSELLKWLEYGIRRYSSCTNNVPLVMIGHTKDFFNEKNLRKFFREVKKVYQNTVTFSTFKEFSKYLEVERNE